MNGAAGIGADIVEASETPWKEVSTMLLGHLHKERPPPVRPAPRSRAENSTFSKHLPWW